MLMVENTLNSPTSLKRPIMSFKDDYYAYIIIEHILVGEFHRNKNVSIIDYQNAKDYLNIKYPSIPNNITEKDLNFIINDILKILYNIKDKKELKNK